MSLGFTDKVLVTREYIKDLETKNEQLQALLERVIKKYVTEAENHFQAMNTIDELGTESQSKKAF